MRKVIISIVLALFTITTLSAEGFNTLTVGAGYRYSSTLSEEALSYHGPGIALSNMNSVGDDGLIIYEDFLIGFPLSLNYGDETRNRSGFASIESLDASIGVGYAGRSDSIRYFMGGGIQLGLLGFSVRCGNSISLDLGIHAMAGVDILINDILFIECSVTGLYTFCDFQHVAMSSRNGWSSSIVNTLGVQGKVAVGFDFT